MIRRLLLVLIAIAAAPAVWAQCVDYGEHMQWLGGVALPASCSCIAVDSGERHAYLGSYFDAGLMVVDMTDPAHPALVDTLFRPGEGSGIALGPAHAYLAAGFGGIVIVDRSNPADLAVASTILTLGQARDVALYGQILCVADWDAGLQLYDVSNPAAPTRLGGIDLPGFAVALAVSGDIAYVADMVGLRAIDISTPSDPVILGSAKTSPLIFDIAMRGDQAYLAVSFPGLMVVDCSDPTHLSQPTPIYTEGFGGRSISVDPTHAIVGGQSGVTFVDLMVDPPATVGKFDFYDGADAVALDGNRTLCSGRRRLEILELAGGTVSPITEVNAVSGTSLDISGDIACLVGYNGCQVLDVADPSNPHLVGEIKLPGTGLSVATNEASAIVGNRDQLISLDLGQPDAPVIADTLAMADFEPMTMTWAGDLVFVTGGYQGFRIIDAENPNSLQARGGMDLPGYVKDMVVQGTRGFLAGTNPGKVVQLTIVDVSNPDAPTALGAFETSIIGSGEAVAVRGNAAYIAANDYYFGEPRLCVIDVSDPHFPILRSSIPLAPLGEGLLALQLDGDYMYVSGERDVQVVDLTSPWTPALVGIGGGYYGAYDMRCASGHIFLARGPIVVLPTHCQDPSPVELSSFEAVPEPGAIRITWRTSREWDHLGFYVERTPAASNSYARLTERIPPPGPYSYLDRTVTPGITYFYRLAAMDRAGGIEIHGPIPATAGAGPTQASPPKPILYQLAQSHPNPFLLGDRETAIAYSLAAPGRARLRVFEATGRLVAILVDADLPAGEHLATWDGRTVRGESAPAGTYFYRLEAGTFTATAQLVRLR